MKRDESKSIVAVVLGAALLAGCDDPRPGNEQDARTLGITEVAGRDKASCYSAVM